MCDPCLLFLLTLSFLANSLYSSSVQGPVHEIVMPQMTGVLYQLTRKTIAFDTPTNQAELHNFSLKLFAYNSKLCQPDRQY